MKFGVIFKLIVSFTLLLIFLIGFIIVSNIMITQKPVINEFRTLVHSISKGMATHSALLYTHDQLDDLEDEFMTYGDSFPNIWFRIHFNDKPDEDISYGKRDNIPQQIAKDTKIFNTSNKWYDVSDPIIFNNKQIGTVEVALTTKHIVSILKSSIRKNIYLGTLAILLGSIFALLIGLWFVSRFSDFEKASNKIREGNYGVHLRIFGNDEIDQTARAFNLMSAELQRTISALKAAKNQFETIFETAHDGILTLDEQNKIVNCNQACTKIFGYDDSSYLIGYDFFSIAKNIYDLNYPSQIQQALHQNNDQYEPVLVHQKNGNPVYIKLSPAHISLEEKNYISVIIQDVTASYLSKKQITESEARMRAIVKTSLDGVIMLDKQGRITEFSPAAENILGFQKAKILGESIIRLVIPSDEREFFEKILFLDTQKNKTSINALRNKVNVLRKDKTLFPAEITITSLNQEGDVLFVIFIRDITEQEKSKNLLTNAHQQAELANKAKTRFLAMMSHEIRTPIAGVMGLLDLLSETALTDEQVNLTSQAQNSSKDLLAILNDILDWSSIEQGKLKLTKQPFYLDQTLDSAIHLMMPLAREKNLKLTLEKELLGTVSVMGDAGRIRQVIINLLSNAIKFTSKGEITLKVQQLKKHTDKGIFQISVKDEGPGISLKDKELLFKEFSQLNFARENHKGGTGLGLAITQQLVKLMKGNITLESTLNVGSTFIVTLPLKIISNLEKDQIKQNYISIPPQSYHILLVEDVQTNQFIIRKQLENAHYKVSSAWDGIEAVNLCKKINFDIIIMDIAMPHMDGFCAAGEIRNHHQSLNAQTPIIGLSAHAYEKDREKALEIGMNTFLIKPVQKQALLHTLQKYWPLQDKQEPSIKDMQTLEEVPFLQTASLSQKRIPQDDIEINYDIYHQLSNDLGEEIFLQIIGHFPNDNILFIERLNEMKDGFQNEYDAKKIEQAAHSLKGSSSSLGFIGLSQAASHIEKLARQNKNEAFKNHLPILLKEWEKALTFIGKQHLKSNH